MISHKTQYYSNNSSNNIPFSVSRAAATTTTTTSPSGVTIPIQPDYFTELDSSLLQDTLSQLNNNNNNSSCSSGYSSYVGSPASSSTPPNLMMMQRSVSSHSLLLHNNKSGTHQYYHPFSALFAELLDSSSSSSEDTPAVRRVYSAGDLQGIKGMQHNHNHVDSPLSSESSMIIEGMSRVCPYSPEEKKIRIERYKIKRNHRNFNKKIKYACRKTLADRRPRIRGRFARNDEFDQKNSTTTRIDDEWSHDHIGGMEEEDDQEADENNWVNIFDSIVAANLADDHTSSTFGLLY